MELIVGQRCLLDGEYEVTLLHFMATIYEMGLPIYTPCVVEQKHEDHTSISAVNPKRLSTLKPKQ
jgi:hypothetical protein